MENKKKSFGDKKRIAFLTPEYPTDTKTRGGLGSYLFRISHALKDAGYTPEIFVLSNRKPSSIEHDGIKIHRIPTSKSVWGRAFIQYGRALFRKLGGLADGPISYLFSGYTLARALEYHHAQKPYDIIHTSNLETSALFLSKPLLERCILRTSSKRDIWSKADGTYGIRAKLVAVIETYMIKRVGRVYASSRFLAKLHERDTKIPIAVIRPPMEMDVDDRQADLSTLPNLPPRFLVHVAGKFGPRKGTDVIFRALKSVHEQCPDFTMLFIGAGNLPEEYRNSHRIRTLGPQSRSVVHVVLKMAVASVVPSTAETLPNTAIESLMCGTPVIGTKDSSIDELVIHEQNGVLIPQGDVQAMTDALVFAWQGKVHFTKATSETLLNMEPTIAAKNVIDFALYK